MSEDSIKDIVSEIIRLADEIKNSAEKIDDIEYGELLGYAEALTVIKEKCNGEQVKQFGLDFDVDEKYL